MSNALAISAATATLHSLLLHVRDPLWQGDSELADSEVTCKPLDSARQNEDRNQINVFLYHVVPNPSWRNHDLPPRAPGDKQSALPLALSVFYLLTAYGRQGDELYSHRLLASAMQILHDHPVLSAADITAATKDQSLLLGQDLDRQIERVRITPNVLSLEEMSKLWGMFGGQGKYRASVAYQVSVLLIESRRSAPKNAAVRTVEVTVNPSADRPAPAPGAQDG
jgi:hypothetical protein